MTNLRFVVTGGPGAGKTTILNALAERGYIYVTDSARGIIRERLAQGLSPRPPLEQFGRDMLERDIAGYRETRVTDRPVFFDRGVVDALHFLDQQNAITVEQTQEYLRSFPYNSVVFLMPPWKEIYSTDSERDQTFGEAVQVYEGLRKWYLRWDYEVTELPCAAIDQRVDFILKAIGDTLVSL
jgi:predicted ATPase